MRGARANCAPWGAAGYAVSPYDYDREYCVDLVQLRAFVQATQPKVAEILGEVDFDEQYEGDYSFQRRILFTGVPKYDRPHLNVTKTLDGIAEETVLDAKKTTLAGESRDKVIKVATYTITIENDGNRALGPVYVRDLFPPESTFIQPSSVRPTELTDTYANWTLTHLAIGDVSTIILKLNVTKHHPDELVNRVEVCGGSSYPSSSLMF